MKDRLSLLEKTIVLGLDPGDIGFICIHVDGEYMFCAMPTCKEDTGKKTKAGSPIYKDVFSVTGLIDLAETIKKSFPDRRIIAAIEDIHAIHGASAESTFNFGYVVGMQNMFLSLLKAEVTRVPPKKWQSVMWRGHKVIQVPSSTGKTMINDTKATSEVVAKSLFPNMDFRKNDRCRTSDDNKIDSLLICEYMIKKHLGQLL